MYGAIWGDIIGNPYEFDQDNKVKDFKDINHDLTISGIFSF